MRYRDLKDERDAAIARMLAAERLSMKSEFDRVKAEFEQEKARLQAMLSESTEAAYQRGFNDGKDAMANDITARLTYRGALKPPVNLDVSAQHAKAWAPYLSPETRKEIEIEVSEMEHSG